MQLLLCQAAPGSFWTCCGVLAMVSGSSRGGVTLGGSGPAVVIWLLSQRQPNTNLYGDIMRKALQDRCMQPGKILEPFGGALKVGMLVACHLQLS